MFQSIFVKHNQTSKKSYNLTGYLSLTCKYIVALVIFRNIFFSFIIILYRIVLYKKSHDLR